jgi:hypothetical protein
MKVINDPFELIIRAAKELYPHVEAEIQYNDQLWYFKLGPLHFGCCGETIIPYDESELPLINISTHIPFNRMPEILAHELAHVVCGYDAGHGPGWKQAFHSIFKKAIELQKEGIELQKLSKPEVD